MAAESSPLPRKGAHLFPSMSGVRGCLQRLIGTFNALWCLYPAPLLSGTRGRRESLKRVPCCLKKKKKKCMVSVWVELLLSMDRQLVCGDMSEAWPQFKMCLHAPWTLSVNSISSWIPMWFVIQNDNKGGIGWSQFDALRIQQAFACSYSPCILHRESWGTLSFLNDDSVPSAKFGLDCPVVALDPCRNLHALYKSTLLGIFDPFIICPLCLGLKQMMLSQKCTDVRRAASMHQLHGVLPHKLESVCAGY